MEKNRLIRFLCVFLLSAVLALALILTTAVCVGMAQEGVPEETTYEGFRPSFPEGSIDWEDLFGSLPPDIGSRDPWEDTIEPPEGTLPWDDLEWPTLPPSDDPPPDVEWPTLPDGWDTLPEEWDTLPEEWGDITLPDGLPDVGDIDDILAGMDGSLGLPPGALGAGLASQLTVLNVYAERDGILYLKTKAFGNYNGSGWNEAEAYVPYQNTYSADYLPFFIMSSTATVDECLLLIDPVMQVRVLPYYISSYGGSAGGFQASDVVVTVGGDEAYPLYYCPMEDVRAGVGIPLSYRNYEAEYRDWARIYYTELDGETYDYMQRIIEREGFDRNDPDIIEEVAAFIQNAAVYNLLYDRNLDSEPNVALAFLGGYKEGVCRHFATAATLLYRALGIPARYVVGFAADAQAGETTPVKGADAHAWVEVYVNGFGWRYVEVTGSPATLPPTPGTGDGETEIPTDPPVTEPVGIPLTLKPVDLAIRYTGGEVTHSGEIEGFAAYAAKGYKLDAQVSGGMNHCGSCTVYLENWSICDPQGVDVTDQFAVTAKTGVLTVYMYEVTYTSESASKVYDGVSLQTSSVKLTEGRLPMGYSVEITPRGGQTAAGRSYAAFDLIFWYDSGNGQRVDRTAFFKVNKRYGTLSVTAAPLTVKAADAQRVYNGKPLTAKDISIIGGALAEGDYIASFEVEGSQTRIGRSDNVITDIVIRNARGENVTKCYIIDTVAGTLKVTSG